MHSSRWLVVAVAATGCASLAYHTTSPSDLRREIGSAVQVVSQRPEGSCEELGVVVGHAGGALEGGAGVSNERLIRDALDDARAEAAATGATHVQLGDPQLGDNDGTVVSATVTGQAWRCERVGGEQPAAEPVYDPLPPALVRAQAAVLECAPGVEHLTLEIDIDSNGRVLRFRGAVASSRQEECLQAALASVHVAGAGSRTLTAHFSTDAPRTPGSEEPRPPNDDTGWRTALDGVADDILACVGETRVAVHFEFDGSTATARIPNQDPMVEQCVSAIVASIEPPGGAPTRLIHVVRSTSD